MVVMYSRMLDGALPSRRLVFAAAVMSRASARSSESKPEESTEASSAAKTDMVSKPRHVPHTGTAEGKRWKV